MVSTSPAIPRPRRTLTRRDRALLAAVAAGRCHLAPGPFVNLLVDHRASPPPPQPGSADHPVTGGYPVIGVVHPDDLPLAAQARPGQRVRFTPHNPEK